MDILSILKSEHDRIRDSLAKLDLADGIKARRAVVDVLAHDLQVHLTLQKDYLYPEFASLFNGAEGLVDVGLANGATISRRLKVVVKMTSKPLAEQDGYDKKEAELKESVLRHFEFEEQILMPKVRGQVRTEEREDIGQLFLDVRDDVRRSLLEPQAKVAATVAPAAAPVSRRRA